MAKKIILVIVAVVLAFLTKKFYYQKWLGHETIPETGIADEHNYPIVGYTFRQTGIPTGWTNLDIYRQLDRKNPDPIVGSQGLYIVGDHLFPNPQNVKKFHYPVTSTLDVNIGNGLETIMLVQPFLDHPPLGSLIYSLNVGTPKRFDDITIPQIRSVSLVVASITAILVFFFSYLIYHDLVISFLSFFIYSTVTTYILISRFALFENLIIPFYLFSHSLLIFGLKNKKNYLIILSGFVIGLTYLVKEIGLFSLLSSLILLTYYRQKPKIILTHLVSAIFPIITYYSYSYYLAPELTIKLLLDQSQRSFFGPLNFLYSVYQPRVKDFPLEGYWLWGFVSLVSLAFKNFRRHFILLAGFFSFLFFYLFLAGLNYPWYSFPLIPFFVIAAAVIAARLLRRPSLANSLLFFLLPFSSSFFWGYFVYHPEKSLVSLYRFFLLFFIVFPLFIKKVSSTRPVFRLLYSLIVAIIFYQLYRWNFKGLIYIISHWQNLPSPFHF